MVVVFRKLQPLFEKELTKFNLIKLNFIGIQSEKIGKMINVVSLVKNTAQHKIENTFPVD